MLAVVDADVVLVVFACGCCGFAPEPVIESALWQESAQAQARYCCWNDRTQMKDDAAAGYSGGDRCQVRRAGPIDPVMQQRFPMTRSGSSGGRCAHSHAACVGCDQRPEEVTVAVLDTRHRMVIPTWPRIVAGCDFIFRPERG